MKEGRKPEYLEKIPDDKFPPNHNVPVRCKGHWYFTTWGQIYLDNCTCCHTEIEVADQTCYLTLSQYTDTQPTSPNTYARAPGMWQVARGLVGMTSL